VRVVAHRTEGRIVEASLQARISERLAAMDRDRVLERIWAGDHRVWKKDPTEIVNRLGWLTVADVMRPRLDELEAFASGAAADGLRTAVLLGMGGSSLAPEVLAATFGSAEGALELIVLDTTHPATIERVTRELDLETTLVVVASKSGTTTETLSHLAHFWSLDPDGRRFAAITDPGTPLEALATERGFRAVFTNPEDIGGRYSALSLFGLVPAGLIGGPLRELLDGADELRRSCGPPAPAAASPAAALGAAIGEAARAGRDKLTLVFEAELASLGGWVEQLIAESTGKEGVGVVPVVGEPLAGPEAYAADRLFVATCEAPSLDALERAGHPVVRLPRRAPEQLGGEFFRWELATAITGHVLRINPFDQPNVQEAKDATTTILAEGRVEDPGFDDLGPLLKDVGEGDYVAIMAYLDRTRETEDVLQRVRLAIRDRLRVATTVGFGPRFLHSTGQLHKGGRNNGVFVQVVDASRATDVPIPGRDFTFGTLIDAQALGDLRSLRARGRRVARVPLDALLEVS
jgi:glucose-6-phosphate isomerase